MMQSLGRRYVRYFNHCYKRSGTLWEGRFKSWVVDADGYVLGCQRYIEPNPVRAGMVGKPEHYRWSSYQSNGMGKSARLWTPHEIYLGLGNTPETRASAYRALFVGHIEDSMLKEIREAVNQGMALGNDRFKEEVAELAGRRVKV